MNEEIHLLGKPVPKSRPKAFRTAQGGVRMYTPTSEQEKMMAADLLKYKGKYVDTEHLYVGVWFYGANKKADLDNLVKLVLDAMVKANVIADDRKISALFAERRDVDDETNKFPGKPSTTIRLGVWE